MLRKTWGEQLVGGFGIGLVFGLIMFGVVVLGATLIIGLASVSSALMLVGIVALVLAVGAIALVSSALSGIYTAAVYRYATTGEAGDFGTEALAGAFRQKAPSRLGGMLGR
jgi:hypothetical protein